MKRLFKLIWKEHFELEWRNDVQQTISFLLNRRGFSFLAEEYNAEILSRFPREVYNFLPAALKNEEQGSAEHINFQTKIQEWGTRR